MKKSLLLLLILAAFFTSCQKFDPVVDENIDLGNQVDNPNTGNSITKMSDLVISDQFDWSMIRTLDVQITLPEDDVNRILYIYSQDGKRLYYKGHPEDGSNVLRTKVTVPTFESVLFVKYGAGENYPEVGAYLSGTNLNVEVSSSYKSSFKNHGSGDDDECTGCDAKMKALTLRYKGSGTIGIIVYDEKESKAGPGDDELKNTSVSSGETFSFTGVGGGQMHAEITIFVNGAKHVGIHVSCSKPLYVGQVFGNFEIIAGTDKNGGALRECDTPGDDPPDFDCLTMWYVDDQPGKLHYASLADNPVTVHLEGDITGVSGTKDIESLAIDDNGDMYFINIHGDSKLYKIPFSEVDQNSGTSVSATYIGNTGLSGNTNKISNLTFIGNDLYGIGVKSEKVYKINTSNGSITQVGTLGYSGGVFKSSGLTEGLDGTIYLLHTKENLSELWKFNSFPNGGITKVMNITGSKKVESLAAHPNGFLYAADDYKLFKLDPVNLTVEVLVNFQSTTDVEGIDFYWSEELDCIGDPDLEDPCDDDGNYNTTTFGWFTFEYDGMTENIDGTSTWTYTVSGAAPSDESYIKDLSHWALALCEGEHVVTASDPNSDWEVGDDANNLNFYGIKWDKEIDKLTGEMTFSFTLDNQYDVEPVTVGFKAGQNLYYCQIFGPSCEGDPDPPDPEVFGTLAFEDLWPGTGDYDVNDLVVEYDFSITKDNNEYVKSITATFEIRAFGAGLHNGFGFAFPNVDPSDIVSVTGYDIVNTSAFVLNGNGTESGQSKATFILYDDNYRLMQYPGSGIGVNTDHPAPYVAPVTLTMTITFADNAVTYSQLDIGNFNPFVVKDQNRDIEIHLPNYPPTDLANVSYFGTVADDTNPPNKYYLTEDNLPWAILIPERFDYPIEKQVILGAYYHFAEWAQGDGITYADWYKDLPGYRNESVIY